MKKLFFAAMAVLISTAFFNLADAQMLALKKTVDLGIENTYPVADNLFASVYDVRKDELRNPRIVKHFTKNFADVADVNWYIVENGMIAKFKKDHLAYAITYSQDGSWKHTIKYYAKQHVPEDVKTRVTKRFKDFTIVRAREVQVPEQLHPIYLVQIQKGNQAKIVRTSNMGVTVLQNITLLNTDSLK